MIDPRCQGRHSKKEPSSAESDLLATGAMVLFTKKCLKVCARLNESNANAVTLAHVLRLLTAFFPPAFPLMIDGVSEMVKQTQLTQKVCKLDTCVLPPLIHYCKAISRPEALHLWTMLENSCLVRNNNTEVSTLQLAAMRYHQVC